MKSVVAGLLPILSILAIVPAPASAQEIETRGSYCNDNYYGSDGAGITACMEFALRFGTDVIGIGIFGVSPEQKGHVTSDPLHDLARIQAWYGREYETDGFQYLLTARTGIEGGLADEIAIGMRDAAHELFGAGSKSLESTKPTTFIGGFSGWGRTELALSQSEAVKTLFTPYVHGSVGNDVVEVGGGLMLALQPASEAEGLGLLMPKSGAYAPTFGGDGIGVFAGVRAVAHETFYDDRTNPFIAEAGITGQMTWWDFAVIGLSASCTTKPYEGAGTADCKATFQAGGLF